MRSSSAALSVLVSLALCTDSSLGQGPQDLLKESFQIAVKRTDKGDTPLTAALRLGITMRMAGMKSEAVEALDHGLKMCAATSDDDVRDETTVEFCRELVLTGQIAKARELVAGIKMREYDLVAWLFIAQASLETGDTGEAGRAITDALKRVETSGRKLENMGHPTVCALARLCRHVDRPEQARRFMACVADARWKSAMLGDEAEALAQKGGINDALRVAAECGDTHLAVLAHARVAASLIRQKQSPEAALAGLQKAAAKIEAGDTRDFALRVASGRIAAAGDAEAAIKIVQDIRSPVIRLLATMPMVTAQNFGAILSDVCATEESDKPMLSEVLVICCAKKGMVDEALKAAAQTREGWPRVRALCGGARHLKAPAAAKLLEAATRELPAISNPSWRCHAQEEMALCAYRAGDAEAAARHIAAACDSALRLTVPEETAHALPQVVESALVVQNKAVALKTLTEALKRELEAPLRETLLPMLIDAGAADEALQACAKTPLKEDFPQRMVAYRLAKAGRVADAVKYVSAAHYRVKAEALADIALAQLPAPKIVETKPKLVGMSFHGGWMYWMARLERLGLPWEIMPFSTPYAAGSAGLAAKYSMLGYPGTGGHQIQVSAAGEDHVRDFLHGGGGLFGICAGQLFANGHPYGHKFVPTDFYYMRGQGAHQVQMPKAHPMSLTLPREMIITRMNGDFLLPRAGCDVIGWYDRQNICAAVVTANYGLGRVVASSPHPESGSEYNANDRLCIAAMLWILEEMP
ncbi:hypothetical protein [Prosthecobacter sp.]|uniref:hypothetical protein n=1 Tax=Prosthecobacter sp. TaxID=1965333 RepID=UPI003784CFA2